MLLSSRVGKARGQFAAKAVKSPSAHGRSRRKRNCQALPSLGTSTHSQRSFFPLLKLLHPVDFLHQKRSLPRPVDLCFVFGIMIAYRQFGFFVLAALATLVSAALGRQDFRGQIQPNAELGHVLNLGPNTRVLLHAIPPQQSSSSTSQAASNEQGLANDTPATQSDAALNLAKFGQQRDRSTTVAVDGSFIFRDLEQGAYTLQVVSRTHSFEKYRIDILDAELGKAPQIRIFTP